LLLRVRDADAWRLGLSLEEDGIKGVVSRPVPPGAIYRAKPQETTKNENQTGFQFHVCNGRTSTEESRPVVESTDDSRGSLPSEPLRPLAATMLVPVNETAETLTGAFLAWNKALRDAKHQFTRSAGCMEET
jgi:hypothetical protein